MIWSNNDVANDFTTLKDQEGGQAYPPAFLQCGIEVYRHYQRILWDTELTRGNVMPADMMNTLMSSTPMDPLESS